MHLHDLIRLCIVTNYREPNELAIREQITQASAFFGFYSATDVRIAIEEIKAYADFDNVYQHAVELCRPIIESCTLTNGEVSVRAKGFDKLNTLIRWVSLDLIIVLACVEQLSPLVKADQHCDEADYPLPRWNFFPRFGSQHLRVMLGRGIGDMHMHEMALRQPEDLWRRLVQKEVSWDRVKLRDELFDPWPPLPSREKFDADLKYFLEESHRHHSLHGTAQGGQHQAFLDVEREYIFNLAAGMKRGEVDKEGRRYILTKNTLWRLVRQPDFLTAHGLEAFAKRWYPAVPKTDRDHRTRLDRPGHRAPKSYLKRELSVPFQVLGTTPGLARVELRSTPLKRVADYSMWIKVHEEQVFKDRFEWALSNSPKLQPKLESKQKKSESKPIAARLAVHFRRSTPKKIEDLQRSLQSFDRETAALLKFRCRVPNQASCVARIDMAVAERDMGCRILGFAYRTLRGPVLKNVHQEIAERHAPYISALAPELRAKHLTLPRLGATCHAGEDFGCQLVGLREVADAIHALKLQDGDSIGHGLALGWNPHVFYQKHGYKTRLRVGEHFDSLLWAHMELGIDENANRWRLEIESKLASLFRQIHPNYAGALSVDFWGELRRAQLRFPIVEISRARIEIVKLVEQEFTSPEVFERRNMVVPETLQNQYSRLIDLIEILRQKLLAKISSRGIVVEVHPSSNMRVGGAVEPNEMPTLALLENENILTSIGTDDPGVFATNVEYEYALMEEALIRKNGWPRHRVVALLDRVRRTSIEGIYWPEYIPQST